MTALLQQAETCWKTAPAQRVAFLIDGDAFFEALADALENARRQVWLLGWDFHTHVRLRRRSEAGADAPEDLVGILEQAVRRNRSLHVHVLAWDFAMLYALERQFLPLLQFGAKTHRRIHFAMDGAHPVAASQHQKIAVIDDAVAFAGGFDLTSHRWDTREHRANDPRRTTPDGKPYAPFHDVQIAVDGEAAVSLGDLARQRWQRATGQCVEPPGKPNDAWPESLAPDVRDVRVGISRTEPSREGGPEIREVAALYRASIAAARRWIYIENQYLTSADIGQWLAERLAEPDGPEVVIVGPRENSGWLEESTMGALRDRVVRELRSADEHGRLRVLYPHLPDLPDEEMLNVHSKIMVVDDEFVRVGSSNLSNRSLGTDSECDLSLEANGRGDVQRAIAGFRDDLLAEHLGQTPNDVAEAIELTGSLVAAVDSLSGDGRSLRRLELDAASWSAEAIDAIGAVDPEHPVPLEELLMRFEGEPGSAAGALDLRRWWPATLLAVAVGCAIALRWTPLGDWVETDRLASVLSFFRGSWPGALAATAVFAIACIAFVPVTGLIVAAGLALGTATGIPVAWIGAIAASAAGHLLGRTLWRETVRRLAGDRLDALNRRLARRGILSSAVVRLLPVAPFMVVNLVAGASHIRARDFLVGTALGMLPGTVLLVVAGDWTKTLLTEPDRHIWVAAGGIVLLALAAGYAGIRYLRHRRGEPISSGQL